MAIFALVLVVSLCYSILDADGIKDRFTLVRKFIKFTNDKLKSLIEYYDGIQLLNIDNYFKIYKVYGIVWWISVLMIIPISLLTHLNVMINLKNDIVLMMGLLMLGMSGFDQKEEFKKAIVYIIKILIAGIVLILSLDYVMSQLGSYTYTRVFLFSIIILGVVVLIGKSLLRILMTFFSVVITLVLKLTFKLSSRLQPNNPMSGLFIVIGGLSSIPDIIEMLR